MKKLTDRQREIYNYILGFMLENKKPPTVQEIANNFGFYLNAARCHLLALNKKGVIDFKKPDDSRIKMHRNIEILDYHA